MKKLSFTLLVVLISFYGSSQCNVNQTLLDAYLTAKGMTSGTLPDTIDNLDTAYVGVPFYDTMYFKMPTEASSGSISVNICEVSIDNIVGLPNWASYACGTSSCSWTGLHQGASPYGCAVISGTPTSTGVFNVEVNLTVKAKGTVTLGFCKDITTSPLNQPQEKLTGYKIVVVNQNTTSINDVDKTKYKVNVFPNPVSANSTVKMSYVTKEAKNVSLKVYNSIGKLVQQGNYYSNVGNNQILIEGLNNPGIYMANLEIDGQIITRKIVVRD